MLLHVDDARLDLANQQAASQATIAERVGMDGIIWTREMRNALLEQAVEVIDTTANMEHRLETCRYRIPVALSPGLSDERDDFAPYLCHYLCCQAL